MKTEIYLEGTLTRANELANWARENLKLGTWDQYLEPISDYRSTQRQWRQTVTVYSICFTFIDDVSHVHFKLRWK